MRQFQLLALVFGGTLAVLLVAFLVIAQLRASGTTADASASPSSQAVETSTPSPPTVGPPTSQPSRSIGPGPSLPHDPTPSPEPAATVAPGRTPKPTQPLATPAASVEITVLGAAYIRRSGPSDGKVTITSGRGVILETAADTATPLTLTYELPLSQVPSGMKVARLDAAVCGHASGDFWETYGPIWAEPIEFEVTQPGPDGCWHYIGIPHDLGTTMSDTVVTAGVRMATRFQIDRVVYTLIAR
jgi:hypothetical protein